MGASVIYDSLSYTTLQVAWNHFVTEPDDHSRHIRMRNMYMYANLFREGKDSWRESRLKCIESSLIASLYLASVKKNARTGQDS